MIHPFWICMAPQPNSHSQSSWESLLAWDTIILMPAHICTRLYVRLHIKLCRPLAPTYLLISSNASNTRSLNFPILFIYTSVPDISVCMNAPFTSSLAILYPEGLHTATVRHVILECIWAVGDKKSGNIVSNVESCSFLWATRWHLIYLSYHLLWTSPQ